MERIKDPEWQEQEALKTQHYRLKGPLSEVYMQYTQSENTQEEEELCIQSPHNVTGITEIWQEWQSCDGQTDALQKMQTSKMKGALMRKTSLDIWSSIRRQQVAEGLWIHIRKDVRKCGIMTKDFSTDLPRRQSFLNNLRIAFDHKLGSCGRF